jgi:integrase
MAISEPIRNKNHVKQLADYFLERGQLRNYLLLVMGIHTALRIGDLLCLTWDDVYDTAHSSFYTHITLTEGKTGKLKTVALNPRIVDALKLYYPLRRGEYLFSSTRQSIAAISRVQAWRILHDAAEDIGLTIKVSAHSLRKTFGYHCWQSGIPINVIMEIYNHSSYEMTRRYLGVAQDDLDKAYFTVKLI